MTKLINIYNESIRKFLTHQLNPLQAEQSMSFHLNQMPKEFFNGKVENFLTCLNLTSYLKGKILDDNCAYIFEEMSLIALYKSLFAEIQIADVELLLKEMPKILVMPYDVVEKIRTVLIEILKQIMLAFRMQNA